MLFEIDHAYMHTGDLEKVDHILARNSLLGWIIFRAMPGLQLTSSVYEFHIQHTKPIDLIDFWTGEAMGVGEPQIKTPKIGKVKREEMKFIKQGYKLNWLEIGGTLFQKLSLTMESKRQKDA